MKTINDYATLYYKENVEGEPLYQDVPIECFIEGSKLAIEFSKWIILHGICKSESNPSKYWFNQQNGKNPEKTPDAVFKIFLNEYYEEYEKEIKN